MSSPLDSSSLPPLPTFVKIWKKKAVEEFCPVPYLATLLNCALWIFYGMPFVSKNNTLIYTINGIGFILEAIYLIIFLTYSPRKTKLKILMYLAVETSFMVAIVGCVLGLVHVKSRRTLIVGVFVVIFGTCMYTSPLSIMRIVIRTRSVEYMPFLLSLVSFLNGMCWLAYALLQFDLFVLIPNGLGAILGFAQLLLYACYYPSTPRHGNKPPEL